MVGVQREFTVDVLEVGLTLGDPHQRGRIGMCRLPGYEVAELAADVSALRAAGASTVVSLMQAEELYFLLGLMEPDVGFFAHMGQAGFCHRHFPIRNGGVPASMPEFARLVDELCEALAADETVVLHCIAGHGRTGLVAACCLVRLGLDPTLAIAAVRGRRPGTIETPAQAQFVADFGAGRLA